MRDPRTGNHKGVDSKETVHELWRLLRYVRPYRARLALGVCALAIVGLAEGLIALMITPLVDRILNPVSTDARLPLLRLPGSGRVIYLNSFFPHNIHYVGTVFAIALIVLFAGKALAEYFGVVEIQFVGQAATTDLRNDVY
jgi:ABC-type multidrug transport system fused ATPase/permease subunit